MQSNCSVYPCISLYCWAMWRKAQCCQGWCCHFADRFCLTARRLRVSPQRESLIKFPFIPASPRSSPGITLHYNTLTYAHILLSLFVLSLPRSAPFSAPSTRRSLTQPSLIAPFLQSINRTVFSLNKKNSRTVEEILLCRLVWCVGMKGHGRQRGLLIMKHAGLELEQVRRGDAEGGKRNDWVESQLNITKRESRVGYRRSRWRGVGLKQCNKKGTETRQGEKQSRIALLLLRFALLLTRTRGGTSNCTWKRIRKGKRIWDESLFIYAFSLPKDLTLPHSSDSGGRES